MKRLKRVAISSVCLSIGLLISACGANTISAGVSETTGSSIISETNSETKVEEIKTEISTEDLQNELLEEYAREKYMRECEGAEYKDLMRYEENFKGKKLYLVAKVEQTLDGYFRCTSEAGDEYYIYDIREYDTTKILVDDVVIVWGDYASITKIRRVINNVEVEVPQINARYIDIYDDSRTLEDYIVEQGSQKADLYYEEDTQAAIIYDTMYVVNCQESITLREGPSTTAAEIRQIPLGASVSYIEAAENGFYKVIYLGNTGYALASYLSYQAPSGGAMYTTMRVVNCNESITLRTSPSTSASEICQIPLWSTVSYVETAANGFYKVIYLGKTGYALASYLEFE